jgi:hypothetical protein
MNSWMNRAKCFVSTACRLILEVVLPCSRHLRFRTDSDYMLFVKTQAFQWCMQGSPAAFSEQVSCWLDCRLCLPMMRACRFNAPAVFPTKPLSACSNVSTTGQLTIGGTAWSACSDRGCQPVRSHHPRRTSTTAPLKPAADPVLPTAKACHLWDHKVGWLTTTTCRTLLNEMVSIL